MAVMFLPLLWPAAVAAAEATLFIGSAVMAAYGVHRTVQAVDERLAERERAATTAAPVQECPDKPCPACVPPVGTIRVERIDRVPPSAAHFPCTGDHAHLVVRNQNPRSCACFWNKATPDVACLSPGQAPPYPMK